ncbi:TonB-dependent receptor [Sphingobium chungbukense]|uniref:TonB-dependent receptor n=1 Tax=Sphingobium chungbukense TaxID=56193 RepID=UPI0009FDEAAF|nr:TonB-dependent receptor [Sphingobium chungbukense]
MLPNPCHARVRRGFRSIAVSSASLLALGGILAPAAAQEVAQAPEQTGLGDIVVTAQRYEQRLQDAPISIVAVGGEQLASMGVDSLNGFDTFVPNVTIGGTSGQGNSVANFAIRGIGGAPSGSLTQESAVGVYIDDVLYARPNGALLDLLDIERIEVLRGPQGTLFGRNTAGGAIRYVTKKPSDQIEGNVRAVIGSYDRRDFSGVLNLPLGDIFAARVSFSSNDRDGYVKRIVDGNRLGSINSQTGRLQLRARPTDRLDINFSVDTIRSKDNGSATIVPNWSASDIFTAGLYGAQVPGGPPVNVALVNQMRALMPASVSRSNYCGQGTTLAAPVALSSVLGCIQSDMDYYHNQGGKKTVYGGVPDVSKFDSTGLSLSLSYELSDTVTLNSISGYRNSDQYIFQDWDRTPLPFMQQVDENKIEYFTQELQAIGTAFDKRLKWQAGVFYYWDDATNYRRRFDPTAGANSASEGTIGLGAIENKFITTKSIAAYSQGTFEITDRLSATVGIRWTQDKKDFSTFRDGRGRVLVNGVLTPTQQSRKGKWSNFSPKVSIDYKWTPDIMTYASVAQGFKGGGFNDTLQTTCSTSPLPFCGLSEYQEENLLTYEIGFRSEFFNHRLRFNTTFFQTNYKDQQIQLIDMGPPPLQYIVNGDSTVKGVEVELMAAPVDGLVLRGGFGYVDAKYDDAMIGLSGKTALTPQTPYFRSPKYSYTLGANYSYDLGDFGDLSFDLNYGYKSKQASFPNPTNMSILPSYGILNGRIELKADAGWTLAVVGTNLTNEYYFTNGFNPGGPTTKATPGLPGGTHDFLMGFEILDVGRPREFAVELKYKF